MTGCFQSIRGNAVNVKVRVGFPADGGEIVHTVSTVWPFRQGGALFKSVRMGTVAAGLVLFAAGGGVVETEAFIAMHYSLARLFRAFEDTAINNGVANGIVSLVRVGQVNDERRVRLLLLKGCLVCPFD